MIIPANSGVNYFLFLFRGNEAHMVNSFVQSHRAGQWGLCRRRTSSLGKARGPLVKLSCLFDLTLIPLTETWKWWASKSQINFNKQKGWPKSFYSFWVYAVHLKSKLWKHPSYSALTLRWFWGFAAGWLAALPWVSGSCLHSGQTPLTVCVHWWVWYDFFSVARSETFFS